MVVTIDMSEDATPMRISLYLKLCIISLISWSVVHCGLFVILVTLEYQED